VLDKEGKRITENPKKYIQVKIDAKKEKISKEKPRLSPKEVEEQAKIQVEQQIKKYRDKQKVKYRQDKNIRKKMKAIDDLMETYKINQVMSKNELFHLYESITVS
jgi:succinate dehydrogenase/fumarate reductase flavoprotein subunit